MHNNHVDNNLIYNSTNQQNPPTNYENHLNNNNDHDNNLNDNPDSQQQHYSINNDIILKIADLGLATYATEPLFTVCGTPTYVAPEVISETGLVAWMVAQLVDG